LLLAAMTTPVLIWWFLGVLVWWFWGGNPGDPVLSLPPDTLSIPPLPAHNELVALEPPQRSSQPLLGVWDSKYEAAFSYNYAAVMLRGDRARPNPIPAEDLPAPERQCEIEARVRWICEHRYPEVMPIWRRHEAQSQGNYWRLEK
jgi:hypothetical protein